MIGSQSRDEAVDGGVATMLLLRRQRAQAMVLLVFLIWFYGLSFAISAEWIVRTANVVGPIFLVTILGTLLFRAIRVSPALVWTPYAWFLGSSAAFFGIGPLAQIFGSEATQAYLNQFFALSPEALRATNLLNGVGLLTVLIGMQLADGYVPSLLMRRSRSRRQRGGFRPERVAFGFLILGGLLQYGLILPAQYGLTDSVVPGIVMGLRQIYLMGLMIFAYLSVRHARWRYTLWIFWLPQILVATLDFSKTQVLLTLVLPALGAFLAHQKWSRLILWGSVAVAVYILAQPMVLWGRNQIAAGTGDVNHASLARRLTIVEDYFEGRGRSESQNVGGGAQMPWIRLDYAPVQAFVMNKHDNGQPGSTLAALTYVWIPRILWPSKPIITDLSKQFYHIMAGQSGTSLGLGVFGEGYWNFGWVGVIVLSLLSGFVFSITTWLCWRWMQELAFIYLPCVVVAIRMSVLGFSDFFVSGMVGSMLAFGFYWLSIYLLQRLISVRAI